MPLSSKTVIATKIDLYICIFFSMVKTFLPVEYLQHVGGFLLVLNKTNHNHHSIICVSVVKHQNYYSIDVAYGWRLLCYTTCNRVINVSCNTFSYFVIPGLCNTFVTF